MLSHNENKKIIVIIGIGLAGVIFAGVTWVYTASFFRGLVNWMRSTSSSERAPLITNVSILALNPEKMKDTLSNNGDNFIVTTKMLPSLQILGLMCEPNSPLSLCDLQKQYRKKLRETHPDKTHANTNEAFLAIRDALKIILNELSSTSADNNFQNALFKFGLNELFSIFIAKNNAMTKIISKELLQWQQLREISKEILEQQHQYMQGQQITLNRLEQVHLTINTLGSRAEQLTAEKFAIKTALEKFEKGQLSLGKITALFKAADKFGGLTKIPGYGQKNSNPYGFFENSSSDSAENLEAAEKSTKENFVAVDYAVAVSS